MEFRVKNIMIETGANVALINEEDAVKHGIRPGDRVEITSGNRRKSTAIIDTTNITSRRYIGFTKELSDELRLKDGSAVLLERMEQPKSLMAIRDKLNKRRLEYEGIYEIVKDTVSKKLSRNEITAFVVGLHAYGLDMEEAGYMSTAMVNTGSILNLQKKRVFDKHSIGGVPGDKTTLLVVPIVAAAGLTIPKTSSRAITSAAGTADRAEVLMPVALSIEEMRRVVSKTNGCIAWGGAVHLAPADDIFIKIEYPFSIDPLLLPSIMSKKKAVGATDMVLDVPVGETSKVKSTSDAEILVKDFMDLGSRMGIRVRGAITYGEQPVGRAIGAAAEAREALQVLEKRKNSTDLVDKAASIAGMLLEMAGRRNGKQLAMSILESGAAERKMRQLIDEQGGDPGIGSDDIEVGKHASTISSEYNGRVIHIDNSALAYATRIAGAPVDKKAAILLHKKLGDSAKEGEPLFTIYSDSAPNLKIAEKYARENMAVLVGSGNTMLIKKIWAKKIIQPSFMIER